MSQSKQKTDKQALLEQQERESESRESYEKLTKI